MGLGISRSNLNTSIMLSQPMFFYIQRATLHKNTINNSKRHRRRTKLGLCFWARDFPGTRFSKSQLSPFIHWKNPINTLLGLCLVKKKKNMFVQVLRHLIIILMMMRRCCLYKFNWTIVILNGKKTLAHN